MTEHQYTALAAASHLIQVRAQLAAAAESLDSILRQTPHPAVLAARAEVAAAHTAADTAFEKLTPWL